jgi:hypothetical protein
VQRLGLVRAHDEQVGVPLGGGGQYRFVGRDAPDDPRRDPCAPVPHRARESFELDAASGERAFLRGARRGLAALAPRRYAGIEHGAQELNLGTHALRELPRVAGRER